jgi:AbrB family looped-hinge helix DNA binding protein
MKVGGRGQVTIPKDIRGKFGIRPNAEVEFKVVNGSIVLRKAPKKSGIAKWRGRCKDTFTKLGYSSVDKFVDEIRGR